MGTKEEYKEGRVIVQFHPDFSQTNATYVMENLSDQYNFTIYYWDKYNFEYISENDTIVTGWEVNINVTVGSEKWIASELEKNTSIHRAILEYAIT